MRKDLQQVFLHTITAIILGDMKVNQFVVENHGKHHMYCWSMFLMLYLRELIFQWNTNLKILDYYLRYNLCKT